MLHTVFLEAGPQGSAVPPQSAIVLYVIKYLRCQDLHVTFTPATSQCSMLAPELQQIKHDFVGPSELPTTVARCMLPALTTSGCPLVRCGLGCILRHIVKLAHEREPVKGYIDLLVRETNFVQGLPAEVTCLNNDLIFSQYIYFLVLFAFRLPWLLLHGIRNCSHLNT